jgi:hypothetical protein
LVLLSTIYLQVSQSEPNNYIWALARDVRITIRPTICNQKSSELNRSREEIIEELKKATAADYGRIDCLMA